ncbi:MAG: protein kinase domain-containing protein [Anaerolineae bacterium]
MKLTMRVLEGPEAGKEYIFPAEGESEEEATNILVGRNDVECQAHWRLSRDDPTVSRAHLMLEIRPPNCYVQDNQSLNGIYLRRGNEPERRVTRERLQSGDRLRLGKTVVGFEIVVPLKPLKTQLYQPTQDIEAAPAAPEQIPPASQPAAPPVSKPFAETPPPEQKEPEWYCVRCGERLESLPERKELMRSLDFMCSRCQKEVEAERRQAEERSRERYLCCECGSDVTPMAKSDGRAAELKEVAIYLCSTCGNRARSQKNMLGYWVIKKLGEGGMGEVFKGWHPETGRVVAIKKLRYEVSKDEHLVRRFWREISVMGTFQHPNVVRLYEAGTVNELPVFISEFVPGGDLTQFLNDSGRPLLLPQEVVPLIADSLVGLEYFHRQGYVHRDLKPENILLDKKDGRRIPKIADFGLARSYEKHGGTITRTGEYAGTWMYMPPEQITDFKRVKPVSDVYAMGVTAYFLLSGYWPLPDFPTYAQVKNRRVGALSRTPVQMILHDRRVPIEERRPDLPRALCRAVNKAIAMKPEERYPSAEEFRQALLNSL